MRIILSNLDTIVLNVKYNLVSAVSKKRKRFSRGRRWSSHESGQNWEAKDRPRTAMYTRPLLIICHRLSTGRAKIFLRQFSLFFFSLVSRSSRLLFPFSFPPRFRFYFFYDRDRNRWQHATPLSFFLFSGYHRATETTLLPPRHFASFYVTLHARRSTNRRVYFYDCIRFIGDESIASLSKNIRTKTTVEKIVRSRVQFVKLFSQLYNYSNCYIGIS